MRIKDKGVRSLENSCETAMGRRTKDFKQGPGEERHSHWKSILGIIFYLKIENRFSKIIRE